jgi:sec-independent protein translocase protein TatA
MLDRLLQPEHLFFLLLICLLIFGPTKLPGLGKGLGEAFRGFKDGIKGTDNSDAARQQDNTAKSEPAPPIQPK